MKAPGFHLSRATSVVEAARALTGDTVSELSAPGKKARKTVISETEKAKKTKSRKRTRSRKNTRTRTAKRRKTKKEKEQKEEKILSPGFSFSRQERMTHLG
jgi:hypothetical protein